MLGSLTILGRVANEAFGQSFVDTASHSMPSRVYETTKRSSVRQSVRLSVYSIDRQQQQHAAGLLLSAPPAGNIDRQQQQQHAMSLLLGAPPAGDIDQ